MIRDTILFCYLFTCCITTITLLATSTSTNLHTNEHKQSSSQPPIDNSESLSSPPPSPKAEVVVIDDYVKENKVHKLMSEQDLRRTFQVDSHDQVPEYEILKLTVNDDGSHLISPISDLGEFVTTTHSSNSNNNININDNENFHHQATKSHDRREIIEATSTTTTRRTSSEENKPSVRHKRQLEATKSNGYEGGEDDGDKLIVMNLSTFGQAFKLRLKRNVDFQQRIKDMKMFMAESTKDGQLRYTEIKTPQQAHKQEPHKRAATPDSPGEADSAATSSTTSTTTTTTTSTTAKPSSSSKGDQQHQASKGSSHNNQQPWTGIGSTYHDEDNLAALLIDQDIKTGQLQVDGTIGNDFVIKPMPRATIDALHKHQAQLQQQHQQQQQAKSNAPSNNAIGVESLADLERSSTSARSSSKLGPNQQERAIEHMHDDDPHDDDEMFLDEDEALEMAHLQSAAQSIESNHTSSSSSKPNTKPTQSTQQLPQSRAISKPASERKWRKYRKLMAQTRVPKPTDQQSPAASSSSSSAPIVSATSGRARRHATSGTVQISHHIIYRQKPSSEGSSSDHQHSFMAAPQLYEPSGSAMEQLAANFAPQRLTKRSATSAGSEADQQVDQTDFQEDPLGGQFYLEPGMITGIERAGYSDWSLLGSRHRALPPYATLAGVNASAGQQDEYAAAATNATQHARFKRHAQMRGGPMRARASQVRRKRQAPDTVWPEVLLVVDYDSFLLHGGDSRDVKRYFVSFWNGVDLRYKLLVHPHIRISLAGMIVAKDRDATPYLERNRLRAPNADAVDAAGALTDMGKYLYREDRLPTYDLAVVITKLDMCRRRYEGGRCNRGTAGFAYVGGACVVNKRLEKVNSVAIIEDSGGFSGIIVAAHEVGHLLGCVHDGSPPPSYLGGPGATHCPWEDGFIMSDLRHTERGFRWSQCSVEQFKHFLNGETATCLYNYPHESQMLHRLLPGTMLSLDDQCKRDRGTNACFKDSRVCAQLFCFDSASGYCVSYRPAAEGSPCGEGQVCRNGKCVGEIENIIPDYTHQTQTVIARRPSHSVSRLADNGLSASSTSTATSSPDNKLPIGTSGVVSGSTSVANNQPQTIDQLSSRMDTYPIDTPLVSGTSAQTGGLYPSFGGRFQTTSMAASEADLVQKSAKSARYLNNKLPTGSASTTTKSYQQRSGHQAIVNNQHGANNYNTNNQLQHNSSPSVTSNSNNNNVAINKRFYHPTTAVMSPHNRNQHQHHRTLHTSASSPIGATATQSNSRPPIQTTPTRATSNNDNLLTSSSSITPTHPATRSQALKVKSPPPHKTTTMSNKKQSNRQQQQHPTTTYQQQNDMISTANTNSNTFLSTELDLASSSSDRDEQQFSSSIPMMVSVQT